MRNKDVYLLVGQRGSGKSAYAKRLQRAYPEFSVISRDEILVQKFGSIHTSSYTGEQWSVMLLIHHLLRLQLGASKSVTILLDCWTGDSAERIRLVQQLRNYGATRVVALYFVTPLELINTWFWLKPGIAKLEEMGKHNGADLVYYAPEAPSHDYALFHELARSIDTDGFDEVIRINPLTGPIQMRLPDGHDAVVRIGI